MYRLKIPKLNSFRYRNYSKTIGKSHDVSAATIRKKFLDYFIEEHNHRFIRSSPVTPFCDPTVPFVNAGMNQVCLKQLQCNQIGSTLFYLIWKCNQFHLNFLFYSIHKKVQKYFSRKIGCTV